MTVEQITNAQHLLHNTDSKHESALDASLPDGDIDYNRSLTLISAVLFVNKQFSAWDIFYTENCRWKLPENCQIGALDRRHMLEVLDGLEKSGN